jgi:PIN domain nuclease of toxin-antitoxin system
MNYLLDTHTFIWSIVAPDKIPDRIKKIIQNAQNNVLVSVVSFWEISIKYGLGKIKLKGVTSDELPAIAERNKFSILALRPQDAATGHQLQWMGMHKDPFDRILIWQAIQNNMILLSKDNDFNLYRLVGLKLIW